MTAKVQIEGDDGLTLLQAKALLKASIVVLMRRDFAPDPEYDDLTRQERVSLEQAASKIERCIRFHPNVPESTP